MMTTTIVAYPFVVNAGEGLDAPLARLGTVHKVPAFVTEGRLAIVEHTLPPKALAAPVHRHSREDELSIVLEGTIGALLGEDVVTAGPGAYVLKPRGQWHTFWNAGETPLRFIELIIPGGFDGYFARLSPLLQAAGEPDFGAIQSLAAEYGIEFDFESVPKVCERFGLTFG
jgi:quercetin dioxygenase-like cupin family protein